MKESIVENLHPETIKKIEDSLNSAPVVLFMKGDRSFPQCGFSARVVDVLEKMNVTFETYDILADEELRTGLKVYSNWPTFPQLYLKGELVGGHDIVVSMLQSGELQKIFSKPASQGV